MSYQFVYDTCVAVTDYARPRVFTKERAPNSEKAKAERVGSLAKERYFFHTRSDTSTIAENCPVLRSSGDLNSGPEVVGTHGGKPHLGREIQKDVS